MYWLLPLPLKDNIRCRVFPRVTVILIIINLVIFVCQRLLLSEQWQVAFLEIFGFTPANLVLAFNSGKIFQTLFNLISMVTQMFLHLNIWHLGQNVVYLYVFGRAVEARLGQRKYACFYLLSGLTAAVVHLYSDPTSAAVALGASGAIAGVLGAYLFFWPKAEIYGVLLPVFMPLKSIDAYWFLIFWFGLQLTAIVNQTANGGFDISSFAHIGGFLGGLAMAFIAWLIQPQSNVCYVPRSCEPCERNQQREQ